MKKKPARVEETAAAYAAKKPAGKNKEIHRGIPMPKNIAIRGKKLDLDAEELALHAAVSTAAGRDLGR